MWKLNNSLLNDNLVKEEIKKKLKTSWNLMKMLTQHTQTYGTQWDTVADKKRCLLTVAWCPVP